MPKSHRVTPIVCCLVSQFLVGLTPAARSAEVYTENTGREGNGDHVVGPEYVVDPDLTDRGNPQGRQFEFTMPLADSEIFPGTDATLDPRKAVRTERKIVVYVPAAYKDGTKAPFLVTLDGPSRLNLVRNALDNLTISTDPHRRLPAFIVIAVENGGNDGKGSERGLEYDTMSDRFARFINDEVLPAVLNNVDIKAAFPNLSFTDNPWGHGVMGCSSGGAAALTMGWFRPDLFRRIVTYSGTFVDQQDDDAPEESVYPLGAWEYHSGRKLIDTSEKKPLRIFTHVSENDLRANDPEETHHNWVMANRRTAAALQAKGYDYVATVRSGGSMIPEAAEMERLFPDTDHFITHYGVGAGNVREWGTVSWFGSRYELVMKVEVTLDYSGNEITKVGVPTFSWFEIESLQSQRDGGLYTGYGEQGRFGAAEWKQIVEAGGDLSVIGIEVNPTPVPRFSEYVTGMRKDLVHVKLVPK